jgi:hypothetical protein
MPPRNKPQRNTASFVRGGSKDLTELRLTASHTGSTIHAAAETEPTPITSGRFEFVAYTGAAMVPLGWWDDVIIDLTGVQVPSQTLPALVDHMPYTDCVMGQTDTITIGDSIVASGEIKAVGEEALKAISLAQTGFQFQASIGARILSREWVDANVTTEVNGRTVTGPCCIVRQCVLREISVVVCGADGDTSFTLTEPSDPPPNPPAKTAPPATDAAVDASQTKPTPGPQSQHLVTLAATSGRPERIAAMSTPNQQPTQQPNQQTSEAQIAAIVAAQLARSSQILAMTQRHPEIQARALGEGWDVTRAELEVLRAERVSVQAASPLGSAGNRMSPQILEAAFAIRAGVPAAMLEPHYGKDVVHAATSGESRKAARLSHLLNLCLAAAGKPCFYGAPQNEDIRAAFEADRMLRASGGASGVSNISISGILSNAANKKLLQAYQMADRSGMKIFAKGETNDFKTVDRYQITGDGAFKKVAPDGSLEQGVLSEEKYTNKVDTFGRVMGVSRQDFVNDDLGAFNRMAQAFGRSAIITLKKISFGKVVAPRSGFYSAGNKNLLAGAGNALSDAALIAAVKLFAEQKDSRGEQIGVIPKYLLVPPSLAALAKKLYVSTNLQELTSSAKPIANVHANQYEPLTESYLGTAGGLGGSDTNWWLFGDPMDVASFEIVYLFGNENPTIETSDLDFDKLGVAFRAYLDFGTNDQDHRGSVYAPGA